MTIWCQEAMHVRGELNAAKTECQAIQRHVRVARMFGLPEQLAITHAQQNYHQEFPRHPYHSANCHPRSKWDEQLNDAFWNA
ncbi:MAG: hypothetical protein AB8B63_09895 [Granulosicoccus sp.]